MLEAIKKYRIVLSFTLAYLIAATIYFVSIGNFEFLWYIAVVLGIFLLVLFTLKRSGFDRLALWGLSIWGLLHMAGGGIIVNDAVLYAYKFWDLAGSGELTLLKYDQVVHAFGFAVATVIGYQLLRPYLNSSANWKVVYPLLVLVGMGLGVVNEIVEFVAVLSFPETGVGGYFNTSLDLVFNTIGAILAIFFIHFYYRKRDR